jgi:hypothetical protein
MADASKVQMGTCDVSVSGIDIGHTAGGVEVTYEPEYADVVVDKYGNTVVDKKLIGEKMTVKVPFAEYTIANLNKAIAESTLAGSGNARLTIGSKSGKSLLAKSAQIVIHPQDAGASRAYDIVLYKASPVSEITLQHKLDEQKTIMVEFQAFVDETKSDGNYLGLIGDSAA